MRFNLKGVCVDMKKTQEIFELPIISILDGSEVGKIKGDIINGEKGAVDYIVVDGGAQMFSTRVIATKDVIGIGEYALTVQNEDVISDINKIPESVDLLQKKVLVKGSKVMTKKGSMIGEIGDIFIDEDDNCNIVGLEFIQNDKSSDLKIIPRAEVITFGANLTIVNDTVMDNLVSAPGELSGGSEKKNS
jgi:uncharacterized protein YrrD